MRHVELEGLETDPDKGRKELDRRAKRAALAAMAPKLAEALRSVILYPNTIPARTISVGNARELLAEFDAINGK